MDRWQRRKDRWIGWYLIGWNTIISSKSHPPDKKQIVLSFQSVYLRNNYDVIMIAMISMVTMMMRYVIVTVMVMYMITIMMMIILR